MAVTTSAGTIVSVSALAPATFDGPGYLALAWTPIGEVTNAGEFGREYEKVEFKPLARRGTGKKKGGYDEGAINLVFGIDDNDAGQAILRAAVNSDADYYLRIDRQDGTTHFMPVQAFSYKRNIGERGQIVSATVVLEITSVYGTGVIKSALGPATASFVAGAASGSAVAKITGLSAGETVTGISPNDGRLAIANSGTALVVGLTASASGTVLYTLSTSSGRQLAIAVTATAQPSFNVTPYDFSTKTNFLAVGPVSSATTPATAMPADGYIDLRADGWLHDITTGTLFQRWAATGSAVGTNSNFLFQMDGSGYLWCPYYDSTNAFLGPKSTAKLSTLVGARQRFVARVVHNGSANTINGFAPGTSTFFVSLDNGQTWTQLGTAITTNQKGFTTSTVAPTTVGSTAAQKGMGRIYKATALGSTGNVIFNADFTALQFGQKGNFNDTATSPNTWTLNGAISCDMTPVATSYTRMTLGAPFKWKVMEILPDTAYSASSGSWGLLWNNYPQARMADRIAWAKLIGCNAVKWNCNGIVADSFPAPSVLEGYIKDACSLLRSNGLYLYLQLMNGPGAFGLTGGDADMASRIAQTAATAALWMKYGADLIFAVDISNEQQFANNKRPSTWGAADRSPPNAAYEQDMTTYIKAVRTVMPDMPFSFASYVGSPGDMANNYIQEQAVLGMQYHDYHPYDGQGGANSDITKAPSLADVTLLESQGWSLPMHFGGEGGCVRSASTLIKQTMINGMIAQTASARSAGTVFFGDYDYGATGSGDFGIRQDAVMTAMVTAWNPGQPATPPAAPISLFAIASNGQVGIQFVEGAPNGSPITSHKLYRGTASGGETLVGTVTPNANGLIVDTGLTNGVGQYYRLSAVNAAGVEGALSAEITATPSAPPAHYLNAPGGVVAASCPVTSANQPTTFVDVRIQMNIAAFPGTGSAYLAGYSDVENGGSPTNSSGWALFINADHTAGFAAKGPSGMSYPGGSAALPVALLGVPFTLRAMVNTSGTNLTRDGFVLNTGSVSYYWSTDGKTWTPCGTAGANAAIQSSVVGNFDVFHSLAGSTALVGKVYGVQVFNAAGVALINADFTALATGATSFNDTAATPNAWTINSSAAEA